MNTFGDDITNRAGYASSSHGRGFWPRRTPGCHREYNRQRLPPHPSLAAAASRVRTRVRTHERLESVKVSSWRYFDMLISSRQPPPLADIIPTTDTIRIRLERVMPKRAFSAGC